MPAPKKNETQKEYVARCIKVRHSEHPKEPNKQNIAICYSMWREHKK